MYQILSKDIIGSKLKVINAEIINNYSIVLESENGEYLITNLPLVEPVAQIYQSIIYNAEKRKNKTDGNRNISISDIVNYICILNRDIGEDIVHICIEGYKLSDINQEDIICIYKFPVDAVYMAIFKGSSNTIVIFNTYD